MRQYVTIQNFDDISKAVKEIQAQAVARDCALGGHIDIVGTEAIERFKREYCPDMVINTTDNPQPKTDGKTSAVILPYISAQVYGDSRNSEGKVVADRYCYMRYIIEYQNELYLLSKCRNEATGTIILYSGPEYHFYKDYLPYGWDEAHPCPNKVGVLSDKKLNEWRGYLNERREAANKGYREAENRKDTFREALAGLNPNEFEKCEIGQNSGTIIKNGLEYSFRIDDNGYIRQDIKVRYTVRATLDNFLAMANGSLVTPKTL